MPQDPRSRGPKPPQPSQQQDPPGLESEMDPKPDYGEETYKGSGKLAGKAALITGGDSGIGRAVALAFAREGADVLVSYLNETGDAMETARVVDEAGRRCVTVPGDITDEAHCKALVERAVKEFGKIDLLVNNAAHQMTRESIKEISTDEFDRTMKTNVYAMFWLCREALPYMPKGASVINTSSIQADSPSPQLLAYAATKAAIQNFTGGLAQMLGKKGIRVNCVAPGPIWTPLIPATMPPEKVKNFGADVALGRPGQPAELAPVFVLLASDDASYMAGATVAVTGGKPLI
ncbi:oxidoreductase : Short-chain dehydrogenase/reductase SDR OS=Nostoc punctiforme (strain ATCC 29133 / PCC 73102) GN=Npun_F0203 PE=4 SV=1: adh_short_C2 [Gemmataceae bacterium]|nr:oxidoreductase : Short-chain dehydrogenase/reductase SDR OS=Nostoc punctiforme (strain ATCC 29133 / PCC 73102) GN=Npun_F0203 PE=4 SV=1: adh_short_C2 [Gemmataceae bacterium]VTT99037.1 oxidoreductase : Short-chain dehydrogenase/reductase SDR OS=Nostoc punctiforme (strain ATCC 29133 / PCC 73102) GN=Npun_F0203 PE=4 SV=1: adh_short_C2 [Gemmataceae bacterium]